MYSPQPRFRNKCSRYSCGSLRYSVEIRWESIFHSFFLPVFSRKALAFKGNLPRPLCFQSTILQASEPNILWPSVQMSVSSARLGLTFVFPAPHPVTGME